LYHHLFVLLISQCPSQSNLPWKMLNNIYTLPFSYGKMVPGYTRSHSNGEYESDLMSERVCLQSHYIKILGYCMQRAHICIVKCIRLL